MNETIPRNNCVICARWQKTPFFKRPTTATTAQDTETSMVLGYWVASRRDTSVVARMCERHSVFLDQLDTLEGARTVQAAAQASALSPEQADQQGEFQRRAAEVTQRLIPPTNPNPGGVAPLTSGAALLGATPEPLAHEAFGKTDGPGSMLAHERPSRGEQPVPAAPIPEELPADGKPTFPCPLCRKVVSAGAVHECA
jgi:hypothetical protein